MMTEQEYNVALDLLNQMSYKPGNWNAQYREKLAICGLRLTDQRPNEMFYINAPWPTPDTDGKPISPERDPASWPVPSYIVPLITEEGPCRAK